MQDRQRGFFDFEKHEESQARFKNPLSQLQQLIKWEEFLPILETGLAKESKGFGGRPPYDRLLMFKILVLQTHYNLTDDQIEYQIHDRSSFRKFLGLEMGEQIPDAKTIWLFRNQLAEKELVEPLFERFGQQIAEQGYRAQKGQILDASIIPVPKQRNPKEENEQIKSGEIPPDWLAHPHKLAQKDTDARWTKKNNVNHYGYKNHISSDVKYKLIREYLVSDAALHDSQAIADILDPSNTSADVYGDSAYRSVEQEQDFKQKGYRSKVNHKGKRNHPLSEFKKQVNKKRSQVRARVEHVFGHQTTAMAGKLIRCIGIVRAKATIGLRNLVYNMHRFVFLHRNRSKLPS
jgi:transposase, IS5 family